MTPVSSDIRIESLKKKRRCGRWFYDHADVGRSKKMNKIDLGVEGTALFDATPGAENKLFWLRNETA